MNRIFALASVLAVSASFFLQTQPVRADDAPAGDAVAVDPNAAPEKAVTGKMDMTFTTRTRDGRDDSNNVKIGVTDTYNTDLTVNGNREITGSVSRQPKIMRLGIQTLQQSRYDYALKWVAILHTGPKTVGSWTGMVPVDNATGAYDLAGGADEDRPLRISVDVGLAPFESRFGGKMYGKPDDASALSWSSIVRVVNGKTIEKKYQADPMRFENLVLAEGPDKGRYPDCVVNGALDYDRETSNYYAKDIHFKYSFDGKDYDDVMTGTIKWVDPAGEVKGHYEFNLRYNEDKNVKPVADDKTFANMSDDDAMFAVQPEVPALVGTIAYDDDASASVTKGPDGDPEPNHSIATYDLQANHLTKQQVMNFVKLWLIAVGPTNDE